MSSVPGKLLRVRLLLSLLATGLLASSVHGQNSRAKTAEVFRGGRVGWARLKSPDQYWQRHAESDDRLSSFIRSETRLNIDPTWYTAEVENLPELCTYPLVFANTLKAARTPQAQKNLAEYLNRGGFLVIDACINGDINPDPEQFLATHIAIFSRLLPGCTVRELPNDHEIYSCFFNITNRPPHTYYEAQYDPKWARMGLRGVYVGDRMVAVITLSGLQCGWAGVRVRGANGPKLQVQCMEMMLNIYIYAMTR